jgi:hypothetical protein
MVTNRSVPADTVLPHLTYRDAAAASTWLADVFGFTEYYRYGPPGAPSGVQMHLGDAWIMRQYGAHDLDGHHWLSRPTPATSAPPNGAQQSQASPET